MGEVLIDVSFDEIYLDSSVAKPDYFIEVKFSLSFCTCTCFPIDIEVTVLIKRHFYFFPTSLNRELFHILPVELKFF